jgi:tetratricopeptide (TPR) repeat protein
MQNIGAAIIMPKLRGNTIFMIEFLSKKISASGVLLISMLFFMACSNNLERAANDAALAEAQLASGDIAGARASIQKAITDRDDMAAYYILLGRIEIQAQRPISAFNAFTLAQDLEADNQEILQSVADLGLQVGRLDQADAAADRLLLLVPNATGAMLVKGFIAVDRNNLKDAAKIANDILTINKQDQGGVILASRIDALQGNPAEALKKIDALIAEVGQTDALNITRLEVYRMLGDGPKMATLFPDILRSQVANKDYPLDYVNLLYKLGDVDKARAYAKELIKKNPDDRDQLRKIMALWAEHDDAPLSSNEIAILAKDAKPVTCITLARHYLAEGQPVFAKQLLGQVKSVSNEAQTLFARVLWALGTPGEAYQIATGILADDPKNPDALLIRVDHNLAHKKLEKALEDANVVVTDQPESEDGYFALAKANIALGRTIRAKQTYELGMDALPQSKRLAAVYKEFLARIGDRQRMITLDRDLAAASPSSTRAWQIYAESCTKFGDAICSNKASQGMSLARKNFFIDEPPGTPKRKGLFARLSPEQLCKTQGGVCRA